MSDVSNEIDNPIPAEMASFLDSQLANLRLHREIMDRHQINIDRLKAESIIITNRTDATLAEIRQVLDSLQR